MFISLSFFYYPIFIPSQNQKELVHLNTTPKFWISKDSRLFYRFLPKDPLAGAAPLPFLALPLLCSSALRLAPEAVTDVEVDDTVKKLCMK